MWTPYTHLDFPRSFKSVVKILLMMSYRSGNLWSLLPREAIFEIIKYMEWDWFEDEKKLKSERSIGFGPIFNEWWDFV